jgi:divalent metal cation (Fe/Co/Zn/Cd) transporter
MVFEVPEIRVRWLGREAEARVLIRLPADMTLHRAHEVAHLVQERVLQEIPDVREVLVEPAPASNDHIVATRPIVESSSRRS